MLDQQDECVARGEDALVNWYLRLLNAFEYFAFFVNKRYLTEEMKVHYKDMIKELCEHTRDYPRVEKHLKTIAGDEFNELRIYYKKALGKELPF